MARRLQKGALREEALLLAPALLLLVIVVIVPLGVAVRDSLHFRDLSVPGALNDWVGDRHFRTLLAAEEFSGAVARSLRFATVVTAIELLLGVPLALWLHGIGGRTRQAAEVALLVPLLAAPVTVGLCWLLLLQPDYGVVPWLLDLEISLLASPEAAKWTIRWVDVWQWTPFVVLLCLAGLDAVPQSLREAASLDGLGLWQRLRSVEWPHLAPVLGVIAVLRFLEAFKVYDTVTILTNGGPGRATELITLTLNRLAFQQGRFGYAAAATLVLDYLAILLATVLFLLLTRKPSQS